MECAGTMRRDPRFRGSEGSSDWLRWWQIRQDAMAGREPGNGANAARADKQQGQAGRIRCAGHFCTSPSGTFLNKLDESDASKSRRHASNVR